MKPAQMKEALKLRGLEIQVSHVDGESWQSNFSCDE